jgi:hypothetical protein
MIPVFQTRTSAETLGNCFEACLASILELPLARVPDRAAHIDAAAWAETVRAARARGGEKAVGDLELPGYDAWENELRIWLGERGLGLLELRIGGSSPVSERSWLADFAGQVGGHWIGVHETEHESAHAVVYCAAAIVHNPLRGVLAGELLGRLVQAWLLIAGDPRRVVARLGPELLPDVAGRLAEVAA